MRGKGSVTTSTNKGMLLATFNASLGRAAPRSRVCRRYMLALGDSKSAFLFSLISTCGQCFANAYASSWASAAAGAWPRPLFPIPLRRPCPAAAPQTVVCSAQWEAIGGGKAGNAVCKRVLEKGWGKMPQKGVDVEVEYVGTLGERDWSVGDVLECWLQVRGLGTGSQQVGDWG